MAIGIVGYLFKRNKSLEDENRDLRNRYTSDLKENIESMVEINQTIRNLISSADMKTIENKIDSLASIIMSINATLTVLQGRLNSLK